jgi:hypothetical protein
VDFAISDTGVLLYQRGSGTSQAELVWVDRSGSAREIEPGRMLDPAAGGSGLTLSPSGTRLALVQRDGTDDLWIKILGTVVAGPGYSGNSTRTSRR